MRSPDFFARSASLRTLTAAFVPSTSRIRSPAASPAPSAGEPGVTPVTVIVPSIVRVLRPRYPPAASLAVPSIFNPA